MATVSGNIFDLILLRRVMRYASPYKKLFWIGFFLTIVLAFLAPLRPWLIQYAFDHYIVSGDMENLLRITLLMIALLMVESFFMYHNAYLTNKLGQSVINDIRVALYRHITGFKVRYYDRSAIGTLVTRVISDIETIADIFSEGMLVIMGDILQLTVIIAAMFYTDWRLALVSLSSILILLPATYIFKTAMKSAFQDVRTQVARLNAFVQEHITGMSVLQIFGREDAEMRKFKAINEEHKKAHVRTVLYFSIFLPVVEVLSAVSVGLLVWWGAKGVLEGHVTLGNIMAFILYIYMLFRPIRQLADRFNTLQLGMVSAERVFRIFDTDERIANEGKIQCDKIRGDIEFRNVWFAYNKEEWALRDLSFHAEAGMTIAIVGATGAGKTSVINILNRFYEFSKGNILIDGVDIRMYELHVLRSYIGVVLQDVFLFSDTVLNNITLCNSAITQEMVMSAAKEVGVHEMIQHLPGGYDYNVRERGIVLSVGQRQLIAFLRAYVHNPKILVLDEATSSVDSETEQLIQLATRRMTANRTSIVIAHRLATVQSADRILVMDKGRIIEEGTHEELLVKEGNYKKLFDLQFKYA